MLRYWLQKVCMLLFMYPHKVLHCAQDLISKTASYSSVMHQWMSFDSMQSKFQERISYCFSFFLTQWEHISGKWPTHSIHFVMSNPSRGRPSLANDVGTLHHCSVTLQATYELHAHPTSVGHHPEQPVPSDPLAAAWPTVAHSTDTSTHHQS